LRWPTFVSGLRAIEKLHPGSFDYSIETTSASLTKTVTSNREFQAALLAFQVGNLKDAERRFKAVLRAQPKHLPALNLMGIVLTQLKRFADAELYFRRALAEHPNSDATLYNYGIVLKALSRPADASDRFSQSLKINPAVAETWNNRGTIFNELKRHEEAIGDFDKAIALSPRYAEAFCNKGKSLTALKRPDEGLEPDLAEAWLGCGNVLFEGKRYDDAFAAYDRALKLKPDLAEAWLGRGKVSFGRRVYDDALADYNRVLELNPDLAEAWLARGGVSFARRQYDEALADYDRALVLKPDFATAWLAVGNVFLEHKRHDEAFAAYDKAEALNPGFAEAWLCRGNVFLALEQHDDALASYDRALQLKADLAEAWTGRGTVLLELERLDDAFADFNRALELKPDLAEAWLGRGSVLSRRGQFQDALAAYDRTLALKPDLAKAWLSYASVLLELKQYDHSFLAYDKALALDPDVEYAAGYRLLTKLHMCDWTNLAADIAKVLSSVREGKRVSVPFALLSLTSSPADQLQCAKRLVRGLPVFAPVWSGEAYSHDRIRVAYLSADFRNHAVAHLTAGLFEHHDKSRFEVTGISIGPAEDSAIRQRLESAFERFMDFENKSDEEIAKFIRNQEIDIAVDLMGHTRDGRLGIFARRPAPIQVHYIGYAGTIGTNYIDYILADSTVIPEDHQVFYAERVVWLPDSYLASDYRRAISPRTPTRRECELPENGFVFCSFNNPYKFGPKMFQLWMRLLRATPSSVLWLSQADPIALANLRREAERCSVSANRLIFASKIAEISDHLARQRQADLFLDTLPYNAHTTASDALWAGLPVLTCLGETFAGRVAASLLKAVGLPELIATSLEEYETLALQLACDPSLLALIKAKLARNRDTCPLFDTERFTRHVETAYVTMWQAYREGRPPAAFAVKDEAASDGSSCGRRQKAGPRRSRDRCQ
jgi:protein O-GlcNAc transferase